MVKTVGFIGIVAVIAVALNLQFFKTLLFGNSQPQTEQSALTDSPQRSGKAQTVAFNTLDATDEPAPNTVQYAEGYSEKDFGAAYQHPAEMFPEVANAQPEGVWETLLELKYDFKFDERIDDIVYIPLFTPKIRALNGKEIEVKGFILPHDITKMAKTADNKGDMFIFSAFPAATCFYCGGAGPESIMEVFPKKPIAYSKQMVTIKGRLELNEKDYLRATYILRDARLAGN